MGFVFVGASASMCAVMLSAALSDGRSLFKIDSFVGMPGGSAEYGKRYAVGISHDANGRDWDDADNLFEMLGCREHQRRLKLVLAFSALAGACAVTSMLGSIIGAAYRKHVFGYISLASNILAFITLLIAMSVGWALYDLEFPCADFDLTVKDHFKVSYGPIFLVVVTALFLLNSVSLVSTPYLRRWSRDKQPASSHEYQ
ncbi:hypothetical protein DIPPA_20100 [Diplonema papillatum]|nr:hypothetical protein DIPPA_20100 [Diplonema papillatum]